MFLVVDDEESIRRSLVYFLESQGYQCKEASNGSEALEIALESRPRVIICDIIMPVWDGLKFLEELRKSVDRDSYDPIIIMITGYADDVEIQKAYNLGARWTLRKPIRFAVLSKMISCLPKDQHQKERNSKGKENPS